MKMLKKDKKKKVRDCWNNSEMYQCERCKDESPSDGWYCDTCNDPQIVEFEVSETIKSHVNGGDYLMEWKGETVCPYCFNQLIDIANEHDALHAVRETEDKN